MKGYLGKFVIVLVMMGLFSLLYIALDQAEELLFAFANAQSTDAGSLNSITITNIMWVYLPVAVLFSFLVYNIEKPRKEREVSF